MKIYRGRQRKVRSTKVEYEPRVSQWGLIPLLYDEIKWCSNEEWKGQRSSIVPMAKEQNT